MSRSRRELLTGFFSRVREAADTLRDGKERPNEDQLLRPPGARLPDEDFLEKCTSCMDCVEACPPGAIFSIEDASRKLIPVISPTRKPCVLCDSVPCSSACPEDALLSPEGPEKIRIGIAKVNPRTCRSFHGHVCDACFQACPFPNTAIMMVGGRPIVGSGFCTGCGLCELACPERPRAIQVIAERHLVPGLRVPRSEIGG